MYVILTKITMLVIRKLYEMEIWLVHFTDNSYRECAHCVCLHKTFQLFYSAVTLPVIFSSEYQREESKFVRKIQLYIRLQVPPSTVSVVLSSESKHDPTPHRQEMWPQKRVSRLE